MPFKDWIKHLRSRTDRRRRNRAQAARRALREQLAFQPTLSRLEDRRVLSVSVGFEGGNNVIPTTDNAVVMVDPNIQQRDFNAIVEAARANETLVRSTAGSQAELGSFIGLVEGLPEQADPVTIELILAEGGYNGLDLSLPTNVTLVIDGQGSAVTIQGNSPALTVNTGEVVVQNGTTLVTTTDDPSVLVLGGSLTLRNSTIIETAGGDQAAIEIRDGAVDMGTFGDPGGNVVNVQGTGQLIKNSAAAPVPALGNTWQQDGGSIIDDFAVEDEIAHALDSDGRGVVTWVADNVFVTTASGSVQRGINAVATGGTVNIAAGTYVHAGQLNVDRAMTIIGVGQDLTILKRSGSVTGSEERTLQINTDSVAVESLTLGGWVSPPSDANVGNGYLAWTSDRDHVTFDDVRFDANDNRVAIYVGTSDYLTVKNSRFTGTYFRAGIRGAGEHMLISGNSFEESHYWYSPIYFEYGAPTSGEISYNYFANRVGINNQVYGNFKSNGTGLYAITNYQPNTTTADGLYILHNTFHFQDSNLVNSSGNSPIPMGVYIDPLLSPTGPIVVQDHIFQGYAYTGSQPASVAPLWRPAAGVFGGALEFDGLDDFGVFQSGLFNVGNSGTLSLWVRPDNVTKRNMLFEGPGNGGLEFQIRNSSDVYFSANEANSNNGLTWSSTKLSTGEWTNLQFTWDFATKATKIYINGSEVSYQSGFGPNRPLWSTVVNTINGLMNVGRDPGDLTRFFDGMMDDIGWFNASLSTADLAAIRTGGVAALAADSRLVAHWDFDQASGLMAGDNKNGIVMYLSADGSLPSQFGPQFVPAGGRFGGALEFDGFDDYATFNFGSNELGDKGTLNFWARMEDVSRRNQFFEGPGNGGLEMQFRTNSNGQFYTRTTDSSGNVIRSGPDGASSHGSWRNIQVIWDFNGLPAADGGGKMRIFVDGVESSYLSNNSPTTVTWTSIGTTIDGLMSVGRDPGDASRFFDGRMDDVAWFNDVLSVADRATLRNSSGSAFTGDARMVAYWNLDDTTGTTVVPGNGGTNISLYLQAPAPPTPRTGYAINAAPTTVVSNNVFHENDVDYNSAVHNLGNNLFGDPVFQLSGPTTSEIYKIGFGSPPAYASSEYDIDTFTTTPHIGAYQGTPRLFGTGDLVIQGSDRDDLLELFMTGPDSGTIKFTRDLGGANEQTISPVVLTSITGITFYGREGDDLLVVNNPAGRVFDPINGIVFDGGDGGEANGVGNPNGDGLQIVGGSATTVEHEFTTNGDGFVYYNSSNTATITYTRLEPIDDSIDATHRIFTFTAGSEVITLADDTGNPGFSLIDSDVGGEMLSFANPTGADASVLIRTHTSGGSGADTVNIEGVDSSFDADLLVDGDVADETVNFQDNPTNIGTGNLLVTAQYININADVVSTSGHITLTAGNNVDQNATVSTGGTGTILVTAASGIDMSSGGGQTTQTAGGNIRLTVSGEADLVLGLVKAGSGDVSLSAGGSITDGNGSSGNVQADELKLVADSDGGGLGRIGNPDNGNGTPLVNANALDLTVAEVAASAAQGIYLEETDSVAIDAVGSVDVVQVNFNSTAPTVGDAALSDLTTTANGPIKLVTLNGTITANEGSDADGSVLAHGTGDVLLEARGGTSDVIVNGAVVSGSGNITLDADGNVDVNAAVTVGSGGGTLYILSGADTDIDAAVTTADGDILLESLDEIRQTASISSTAGDIGLIAGQHVNQTATGDITTASGDVLVQATAGTWTMDGDATITAGGAVGEAADVLGLAGTNIVLGVIRVTNATANRVALQAGTGSITDANVAGINVQETVAAAVTRLSLRAGTIIGGAGGTASATNDQALDLNVDTVAASSATGIYLREVSAGGAIVVDTAAAVSVAINGVLRSDFDSSTTSVAESRGVLSLEDLVTSSNGPIKLVAEAGTVTLNGGAGGGSVSAHGTGDVLLEARGGTSDVIVNGAVASGSGNITLDAGDDVDVNAVLRTGGAGSVFLRAANGSGDAVGPEVDGINVDGQVTTAGGDVLLSSAQGIRQTALITSTAGDVGLIAPRDVLQTAMGDITTTSGDLLVEAGRNWTMDGDATLTAGGGDVLGQATAGTITLGVISVTNATANRVALSAGVSILDANAGSVNIQEIATAATTSLSLRAGSGSIGQVGGGTPSVNDNALDLNVDTVAASAPGGIYLREVSAGGTIQVNTAAAVTVAIDGVEQVNFNSTVTDVPQTRTLNSLEDLTTTANGPIKLVAESGSITVNAGTAATAGVSANGTGDVLLEARGAASDVIVRADVLSGTGNLTLNAGDDLDVNDVLTTGGTGTVFLSAAYGSTDAVGPEVDGINLDAMVTTDIGDVLLSSVRDIRQTALITSTGGDVGLIAGRDVLQTATGDVNTTSGDMLVEAGRNWTMDGNATITAGGGDVLGQATAGTITLGVIRLTNTTANRVALNAGRSILDSNAAAVNIEETVGSATTSLSLRATGGSIGQAGGSTPLNNDNALDLNADTVAAAAASGSYLREVSAGGALVVDAVPAVKVDVDGVRQVHFNDTTGDVSQDRTLASLEDLVTTANGPIEVGVEAGTLTVKAGTANTVGVSAHGTGDVLLEVPMAGGIIIEPGVTIKTGTGQMTVAPTPGDMPPPVDVRLVPVDQGGSNVNSLGHAIIEVTVGDVGTNYQITVNWSDGTVDTYRPKASYDGITQFDGGVTYRFDHYYKGNPDPTNAAAPIPVSVTIAYDGRNDKSQGIMFKESGQVLTTTRSDVLTVPGTGLFAVIKVIKSEIVPVALRQEAGTTLIVSQVSSSSQQTTSYEAPATELEFAVRTGMRLFFRRVDAAGQEGEDVELPAELLERGLFEVFQRFPNGRYRVYLKEANSDRERLIQEVNVYEGRIVPPEFREGASERQASDEGEKADEQRPQDEPREGFAPEKIEKSPTIKPDAPNAEGESGGDPSARSSAPAAALGGAAIALGWADQVDRAFQSGRRTMSKAARLTRRLREGRGTKR